MKTLLPAAVILQYLLLILLVVCLCFLWELQVWSTDSLSGGVEILSMAIVL